MNWTLTSVTILTILTRHISAHENDLTEMQDAAMAPLLKGYLHAIVIAPPPPAKPPSRGRMAKVLLFLCKNIPFVKKLKACRKKVEDSKRPPVVATPPSPVDTHVIVTYEILRLLLPDDVEVPGDIPHNSLIIREILDKDDEKYFEENIKPNEANEIMDAAKKLPTPKDDPSTVAQLTSFDPAELERRRRKLMNSSMNPAGQPDEPVSPIDVITILGVSSCFYKEKASVLQKIFFEESNPLEIREDILIQPHGENQDAIVLQKGEPMTKDDFEERFPYFVDRYSDENIATFKN